MRYAVQSELRWCRCCERRTLIVALGPGDEFRRCLRCGANLRYEMLADYLRKTTTELSDLDVVELDPGSPLSPLLSRGRTCLRSFYGPVGSPPPAEGVIRLDVQDMDLPDASVDLLVSSDVLEHVPDLVAAFAECGRVLRPGGRHVFTVPPHEQTRRRAQVTESGEVEFLEPPEYHADPMMPGGILAFWDLGIADAMDVFSTDAIDLRVVAGPMGRDGRVVWSATRRS